MQTYSVTPNQLNMESPYIAHDIQYTQKAYGLDSVQVQDFGGTQAVTPAQLAANRATIDNGTPGRTAFAAGEATGMGL